MLLVYRVRVVSVGEAVTVHPLSQRAVAVPHQCQDLTAGGLHTILVKGLIKGHPNRARDGVDGQIPNGVAVVGVDGDHRLSVVDVISLQGQEGRKGGSMCHPLNCHSVVAEDVNGTVSCLTGGVIVAERTIVSCLPVDDNGRGNVADFNVELFSKVCCAFVYPTVLFITAVNIRNVAHFINVSINSIITDHFTTANILFIIVAEVVFIVIVDELKHVIQSIIILQTFIDELYSLSIENFFVVGSQGDAHVGCLVDLISIRGQVGVCGAPCATCFTVHSGSLPSPPGIQHRWRSGQRSELAPYHRSSGERAGPDPWPGSGLRRRWGCSGSWSLSFGM